jgi:hypothetical protein
MKKVTSDDLSKEMDVLQKQLLNAKAHFDIFMGLRESWPKYINGINCSRVFWNFTMQAHSGMAVLNLCRLYDQNKRAIHLPRFLKDIEQSAHLFNVTAFRERLKIDQKQHIANLAKYPRSLDRKQLTKDSQRPPAKPEA